MKPIHLYLPILLIFAIFSCTSNDENMEEEQEYTSFTFEHHESTILLNCIAAYKNNESKYIKISDLGDLKKNDVSKEIILKDNTINELYFFTIDTRLNDVYKLNKNRKNSIVLSRYTSGTEITDKFDPYQYPQ